MYKINLALNNLQSLISHETKSHQTKLLLRQYRKRLRDLRQVLLFI